MTLPFDHVIIDERPTRWHALDVAGFLELPVHDRVRLILEHKVTFYQKNAVVDPRVALAALRISRSDRPTAA